VVAFIPTGWADATNWNKKNAVSKRRVDIDKIQNREGGDQKTEHFIDVEIRLIPYSEHSTFPELCAFVDFLKPRKVIPTVFSDEKDYAKIEGRFRDMIDSQRAKQMFVNSISKKRSNDCGDESKSCASKNESDVVVIDGSDDDERESCGDNKSIESSKKPRSESAAGAAAVDDGKLAKLISMGFDPQLSRDALEKCKGDIDRAIESLLTGDHFSSTTFTSLSSDLKSAKKSSAITSFFSPKSK
jgi:hypothetical protein